MCSVPWGWLRALLLALPWEEEEELLSAASSTVAWYVMPVPRYAVVAHCLRGVLSCCKVHAVFETGVNTGGEVIVTCVQNKQKKCAKCKRKFKKHVPGSQAFVCRGCGVMMCDTVRVQRARVVFDSKTPFRRII